MSHGVRQDSSNSSRLGVSTLHSHQKVSSGPLRVSSPPQVIRESLTSCNATGCPDEKRIPEELRP